MRRGWEEYEKLPTQHRPEELSARLLHFHFAMITSHFNFTTDMYNIPAMHVVHVKFTLCNVYAKFVLYMTKLTQLESGDLFLFELNSVMYKFSQ